MNPDRNHQTIEELEASIHSRNPIARIRHALGVIPPKRRLAIVIGVSLGVLVAGIVGLQMYGFEAPEPDPEPIVESTYEPPPPEPTTVASLLTGVQVEPELNKRPVTGVMIENSIDARPQAGLSEAGVVFEAIAEGGITRFLALYQTEQPEHIGPIRSARPYYVRWAAGFNAGYVHSGGSPEALKLIRTLGVNDMDHGNHPATFDRVTNRFAPHNVYTSMDRLDALRKSLDFDDSDFIGFSRRAPLTDEEEAQAPLERPGYIPATNITFDISSANYNTSYSYDADTNTYKRTMAGVAHKDERSGDQISPSVVIALETTYGIHPNGIHSVYDIVGEGDVTVYQNGFAIPGTWKKSDNSTPLSFSTTDGEPLELEPGQTWITAIHNQRYNPIP